MAAIEFVPKGKSVSVALLDGSMIQDISDVSGVCRDMPLMTSMAWYSDMIYRGMQDYFSYMEANRLAVPPEQRVCQEKLDTMAKSADWQGRRRMEHTIRRLKDKGLYLETYGELERKLCRMMSGKFAVGTVLFGMLFLNFSCKIDGILRSDVQLTWEDWSSAVELTMITCEPDVMGDTDSLYISSLVNHIPELYLNLFFVTIITRIQGALDSFQEAGAALGSLKDEVDQLGQYFDERNRLIDTIESLREQLVQNRQAFDVEKRRYEKRIMRLEHDVDALSRGEQLDQSETDDDFDMAEAIDVDDVFEDGEQEVDAPELAALPDDGVLFVGGHPNMLKKVKAIHPFWTYQSGRGRVRPLDTTKVVFVWNKHLGHPEFDAIQAGLKGRDLPMLYVSATNMNRLEREMQELYTEYQAKK